MTARSTVCLRRLAADRVEEMRFGRWLANPRVRMSDLEDTVGVAVGARVAGRHVLAIQDTSELNYEAHARRTGGLGTVGNGRDRGVFIHPVLAVDAASGACLGLVRAGIYSRHTAAHANYKALPIEAKESMRWLEGAAAARRWLGAAARVTVVADRESDIYEEWARLPGPGFDLLTRAGRDRALADGGHLYAWSDTLAVAGEYAVDLPARPGKRTARRAMLAVRYAPVTIARPRHCSDRRAPKRLTLSLVDVREINPPAGEEPVHWRLLTTHDVTDMAQAREVIRWYTLRWTIEQFFRTLKQQGLDVESSQVESVTSLERLIFLAMRAAVQIMQLVGARDGTLQRPAQDAFAAPAIAVLETLQPRVEGRTAASRNPHPKGSLAWAAWIIARLGGWDGYPKSKPAGPITMARGLARFKTLCEGRALAQGLVLID